MQADYEDTVTRAPSLEPSAAQQEPDSADTIVKQHETLIPQLEEPTPAPPVRNPYASHGAWPATEGGGLPGHSSVPPPVVQPPLAYGFRVGASRVVALDAIVYLGRKPTAPRIVRGGAPRLVRVPSETSEVSGTHLELRQVGRTVVVTDMRSTNGTSIAVPGHPVRRLRQGETVVVGAGTLIDIGDGNVVEILRLQPEDDNS